jgi:SRSO17 transposase
VRFGCVLADAGYGNGAPFRQGLSARGLTWAVGVPRTLKVEWRRSGERKYYLSNLPPRTALRRLAATIKARWVCEQAHQQLKQELGLDHFEGRSWTGLHRHALMTCIACAYLQHLRLKTAARGKKSAAERAAAQTNTS